MTEEDQKVSVREKRTEIFSVNICEEFIFEDE